MLGHSGFEWPYKDYLIQGRAEPLDAHSDPWVSVATVLLQEPAGSVLQVEQYRDPIRAYEDGELPALFGLGLAEISVDRCLSPPKPDET